MHAEAQAQRAQRTAVLDNEEDYTEFLYSMFGTAVFFFIVQTLASLVIANFVDMTITVKLWKFVLPYIELRGNLTDFVKITTWSSTATVLLGSLRAMAALVFLRKKVQVLDGQATALLMGGLLLAYQYIRHMLNPPVIDTWVYAQTMAGIVAATVIYLGFRPTGHQSAPAEPRTRPTRVERSIPPKQLSNEKSKQP